jgi:hypothetical protein
VQSLRGPAEVKLLGDGHEVLHEPQVQAFDTRNLPLKLAVIYRRGLLTVGQFVLDFSPHRADA